jgi:hypothetical protein
VRFLLVIWDYLSEGTLLEPAMLTPVHMQDARMPAFSFLREATETLFKYIDGHGMTFDLDGLQAHLTRFVNRVFCEEIW